MDEESVKKIDSLPAENCGKYTELELRKRGIGKFHEPKSHEWAMKVSTYHDEDVKKAFMTIKRSLSLLCSDEMGYQYHALAHDVAQIMIDRFLLRRCKGKEATCPGPVVSESSLQAAPAVKDAAPAKQGVIPMAKKSDFKKWEGKIETISDINWIYNHLGVSDVKPEDAPSPGAWAHLQYHRSNPAAMAEFFTKVYPRLIPSKGVIQKMQDKFHDDGRANFDLLDRLLAECSGGSEQVSDIPVVLPERPRLQDQAGQSPISPESP